MVYNLFHIINLIKTVILVDMSILKIIYISSRTTDYDLEINTKILMLLRKKRNPIFQSKLFVRSKKDPATVNLLATYRYIFIGRVQTNDAIVKYSHISDTN